MMLRNLEWWCCWACSVKVVRIIWRNMRAAWYIVVAVLERCMHVSISPSWIHLIPATAFNAIRTWLGINWKFHQERIVLHGFLAWLQLKPCKSYVWYDEGGVYCQNKELGIEARKYHISRKLGSAM